MGKHLNWGILNEFYCTQIPIKAHSSTSAKVIHSLNTARILFTLDLLLNILEELAISILTHFFEILWYLNPLSTVLLENLIGGLQSKKFSAFNGTQTSITSSHECTCINPENLPQNLKIHCNTILESLTY
jgi:hypothetical protein